MITAAPAHGVGASVPYLSSLLNPGPLQAVTEADKGIAHLYDEFAKSYGALAAETKLTLGDFIPGTLTHAKGKKHSRRTGAK